MNCHQGPETLWCFGMEYTAALHEWIARPGIDHQSPLEQLTGETPDISEFTDFDFYQFVIWYDPNDLDEGGQTQCKLGQWLGPTKVHGQGLCYHILKENGTWTVWSMVWPVTIDNYAKYPKLKDEMKSFNDKVKETVGVFDGLLVLQSEADEPEEALFVPVPEGGLPQDEDLDDVDGRDFDPLICAEVILPHKGGDMMAKVIGCKRDANGNLVGWKNHIPTMDS